MQFSLLWEVKVGDFNIQSFFFGGFLEMFSSPELNHNHHLLSQTCLQSQCCVRWFLHVPQFVSQCLLVQLQSHTELFHPHEDTHLAVHDVCKKVQNWSFN